MNGPLQPDHEDDEDDDVDELVLPDLPPGIPPSWGITVFETSLANSDSLSRPT